MGDVLQRDKLDGIDHDFAFIRAVSSPALDMRILPDPDTARYEPAPHPFPQPFRENHRRQEKSSSPETTLGPELIRGAGWANVGKSTRTPFPDREWHKS